MHIDKWRKPDGTYEIPDSDGIAVRLDDEAEAMLRHYLGLYACDDGVTALRWVYAELCRIERKDFPEYDKEGDRHFMISVFHRADLIEYGVSIGCPWLSEKGKKCRDDIEEWWTVIDPAD